MPLVLDSVQHVAKLLAGCLPPGIAVQSAVGVALSGGPDSTALAHLLHRQATRHAQGGIDGVTALIIDHGLREGSGDEAHRVLQWTRKLGIPCEVQAIPWGTPPFPEFPQKSAIEASARTARLILYKRFLRRHGLKHIYLAHHLDDQVETAYLRQQRGTTSALALPGLRAFSGIPLYLDPEGPEDELLALVRPLLDITKAELERFCQRHQLPYVIDPTNANPAYTSRNAFRFELEALSRRTSEVEKQLGPVNAFREWAIRLRRRRATVKKRLRTLLDEVQYDTPVVGTCTFNPVRIRTERPEVRKLFLRLIAQRVSPHLSTSSISPQSLHRLDEVIFGFQEVAQKRVSKVTPGAGVMFAAKLVNGPRHWTTSRQPLREFERRKTSQQWSDTAWHLWDNRFWCRLRSPGAGVSPSLMMIEAEGPWVLPAASKVQLDVNGTPSPQDIDQNGNVGSAKASPRFVEAVHPFVEIVKVRRDHSSSVNSGEVC